ncbi:MAG: aspartate aminotransferase family protein [Deltaproteobacteria bacterium]|nr:aspartate aminotransferase family protein [Deltaproteobacteria bacterium]
MKDLLNHAKELLTPALTFHTDIIVKKAEGLYIESQDGKRYMDFSSGLATTNVGHRPPLVIDAVKRQLDEIIHSGCIFRYESEVILAQKLKEITPDGIDMFFFSNSGAEAVEGAVKLARFVTKRQGIIAYTGAFHGRTLGALTLTTSSAKYRKNYHPLLPSVFRAPYPYCYRCFLGHTRDTCSMDCFEYLKRMLKHEIIPEEIAAIIIEPVLGEGGYAVPPKEYIVELRNLCTEHGILMILDEVQTGIGRTGKWFASEHFNITPDIIAIAKGIASGFPLSIVAGTKEIMSKWSYGAHGTTFGGNPVSCAAGIATIKTIKRDNLLDNAEKGGNYALTRLKDLQKKYPAIGDVRGLGFMIGIEFIKPVLSSSKTGTDKSPDAEFCKKVCNQCEEDGLILIKCGIDKNIIRFMPPLITTIDEMRKALEILENAIIHSSIATNLSLR